MLKYAPILLLAALSACGREPSPTIASGVTLSKSREVLMKGVEGGHSPYIQKRTYTVTCTADNQGGTPDQRADQVMADAAGIVGQVEYPLMGLNYQKSNDTQNINAYAVAKYRCSVGRFEPSLVTSDPSAVLRWAISHGAMAEMSKER